MMNFDIWSHSQFIWNIEHTSRLLLALILGGIVGFERENLHRPAGFRTHILVCIGSALVMITSEFIFIRFSGRTNADPARLGAQVISGIGFLGAGTIIREGFSVKGLTTAASLWAVSCVGIAAGIGFYEGAIAATVLIELTLITLKKIQSQIMYKRLEQYFYVQAEYVPDKITVIKETFDHLGLSIKDVTFAKNEAINRTVAKYLVLKPKDLDKEWMVTQLLDIDGVLQVYES